MGQFLRDEKAQAVTEYVLMIALALSLIIGMTRGFRELAFRLWSYFTMKVTGPAPTAPLKTYPL